MKWDEFIRVIGDLPVFETELLLSGVQNSTPIKIQISRWVKAGKLIQLKRGCYLLAQPYRRVPLYEPYIASLLKMPSYLSLEKAMEFHGLIPEAVPIYTSVTTKRPGRFVSEAGFFDYRHLKVPLFWGYESVKVNRQTAFIASPEKALLDFFYLKGTRISSEYIYELRLQNPGKVNYDKLLEYAKRFKRPGILRAAEMIKKHFLTAGLEKEL